jgi:hypothetical protein
LRQVKTSAARNVSPNYYKTACLNFTNAKSFGEFASEIRAGHSTVLFMPQYREPMALRIL